MWSWLAEARPASSLPSPPPVSSTARSAPDSTVKETPNSTVKAPAKLAPPTPKPRANMGYVAPLSVFAFVDKEKDPLHGELVIGGIPWEFVQRLEQMGGAFIEWPKANVDFDIELYKLLTQRMVLEAGVDLYLHSSLIGCELAGNAIEKVFIENKNGLESLEAKRFIDTTGDGDLAWMAGVPMQDNPEGDLQPSSFCFVLSGVDTQSDLLKNCMYHNGLNGPSQCVPVREKLLQLKADGADIPDFGGPWFNNVLHEGSVAVNITRTAADSTDNRNFTDAECRLREEIFLFTDLLRKHFPEFKDCYVSSTAPQAGIRESRRIRGVHTVTGEEYVRAEHYPDSISRGAHPIDMHASKGSEQVRITLKQPAYVPYRALIAFRPIAARWLPSGCRPVAWERGRQPAWRPPRASQRAKKSRTSIPMPWSVRSAKWAPKSDRRASLLFWTGCGFSIREAADTSSEPVAANYTVSMRRAASAYVRPQTRAAW